VYSFRFITLPFVKKHCVKKIKTRHTQLTVFDVYNCAMLCTFYFNKSSRCMPSSDDRSSICMYIRLSFAKVSVRLSYNFAFVLVSFVGFMVS